MKESPRLLVHGREGMKGAFAWIGSGMSGDVHGPFCEGLRVRCLWSTHLSKLPTLQRGVYLCLYVVLDLFSRFVVAWMVSRKENST